MRRVLFFADFAVLDPASIEAIRQAASAGDHLTVVIKGGNGHEARLTEMFASIKGVDEALVAASCSEAVSRYKFDVFARSAKQSNNDFINAESLAKSMDKEVLVLSVARSGLKPYKIGYTCGVFDLFHIGHLNLLEKCKSMCDYLMVGVCDDNYVREIKKTKPIIELSDRVRILNAVKCVDEAFPVTIEETQDKMLALAKFNFNVLFSGDDWKGSERYRKTEEQFAACGASIEYFPYTAGISTSDIKEKMDEL